MDQSEKLILSRVKAITIGLHGEGKIVKKAADILANLKRAPTLLFEVAGAIGAGAVSELDQVFSEWRSSGAK